MYTKDDFIEQLGVEEHIEENVNNSVIVINVDYDGGISIKVNGNNLYYGEDIETEEDSVRELDKAYDKYVEIYETL